MIIAALSLFASLAQAQTYTVDFSLPTFQPINYAPTDTINSVKMWDVAAGFPNQAVASDWPYITCSVVDGAVRAAFSATQPTWPSSFPASVTCSSGGYSLVMNLLSNGRTPDGDRSFVPSVGITLDLTQLSGLVKTFELPIGPTYQSGVWPAKTSPSTDWLGVRCAMAFAPNNDPFVQVFVDIAAPAGEGYCLLVSPSGVPNAIPLTVLR